MEEQGRFFFFPSRDIQELFASYQTDIIELLQREGLDVTQGYAPDPATPAEAPEREPVSVIILASGLSDRNHEILVVKKRGRALTQAYVSVRSHVSSSITS
jgi:hypothetical protein